jgi:DNA invertase Pin-like site-specific DNA recombinase
MPLYRAYIRKSVEDENNPSASPARQRAAIEQWAAAHGLPALEWYQDLDISGRREANRPDWLRLLGDLDRPGTTGVIVESIDRSHRNVTEFLHFYDSQLEPRGLTLISATQDINLSTTDGRVMATVIMAFAEAESRKAGDRMAATVQHLRANNGRHWGPTPFGCDRDPITKHLIPTVKTYTLNGAERRYYDTLVALFEIHATGRSSYRDTALALNEASFYRWQVDLVTPTPWTFTRVASTLARWQLYAGQIPRLTKNHHPDRTLPPLPGQFEPILDPDLCRRVGAALDSRSHYHTPGRKNKPARIYPLSGILYCGHCGGKLTGQMMSSGTTKRPYYRHMDAKPPACPQRFTPAQPLEQHLIGLVLQLAYQRDYYQLLVNNTRRALATTMTAPNNNQLQLQARRQELERLIDLHTSGLITKEQFISRNQPLQIAITALEKKQATSIEMADLETHINVILSYLDQLPSADLYHQRNIIHSIFDRLEITGNQFTLIQTRQWVKSFVDIGSEQATS